MTNIAIDAMGGDFGEKPIIEGVIQALREKEFNAILVGNPQKLKTLIPKELDKFIQYEEAFPTVEQICLTSVSEDDYRRVPLTILTTHQLLRFYQAFDLLVIDEVDAFPYSNQKMLRYGAKRSLQLSGKCIYLTATPSKSLQKA